jgi:hypothetical protein
VCGQDNLLSLRNSKSHPPSKYCLQGSLLAVDTRSKAIPRRYLVLNLTPKDVMIMTSSPHDGNGVKLTINYGPQIFPF